MQSFDYKPQSNYIGAVYVVGTTEIRAIINPSDDSVLDDRSWLLLSHENLAMLKISRDLSNQFVGNGQMTSGACALSERIAQQICSRLIKQ